MPGRIFINYRRGDDPGNTGRLFDRLQEVFPPQQLFLDVDNIAPGLDFTRELNNRVAQCDILLAIIGKGWIDARDANGERRLDDPEDFVRIEIASALRQGKRVIPILVGDAHMPRPDELPKPLRPLAHRNAVRLTHERFRADTQGLIKALKEALGEAEAPTVSKKIQLPVQPTILVAGIAAAVFGGALLRGNCTNRTGRVSAPPRLLPHRRSPWQAVDAIPKTTPLVPC
jgi:hypothetical protein